MFTTMQEGRGSVQGTTGRGDGSSFCGDAELALKVLRAQGEHGLMTDLARQHDVDRRRLYELRGQAEAVLPHFARA